MGRSPVDWDAIKEQDTDEEDDANDDDKLNTKKRKNDQVDIIRQQDDVVEEEEEDDGDVDEELERELILEREQKRLRYEADTTTTTTTFTTTTTTKETTNDTITTDSDNNNNNNIGEVIDETTPEQQVTNVNSNGNVNGTGDGSPSVNGTSSTTTTTTTTTISTPNGTGTRTLNGNEIDNMEEDNDNDDTGTATGNDTSGTTTTTTTTQSQSQSSGTPKSKRGRKKKDPTIPKEKKKKEYENTTLQPIQPEQITLYSLGALVKRKIVGAEMPSTLEKRTSKGAASAKGRRPNIAFNSAASEDEEDDGAEFEMVDGVIVPKMRGPSSAPVIYEQANYDTNSLINSQSFSKRETQRAWSKAETEVFYEALKKYGTDFTLMETVFDDRSRLQLKNKFKREERSNPERVHQLISAERQAIDLREFRNASEAVKLKKVQREEAIKKAKHDADRRVDEENQQELDDLQDERAQAERQQRFGALGRSSGNNDHSEEVILDEYQQQQQQMQNQSQYDYFSFQSDCYDVGDDYGY
ncbi:hypothetical protein SAMD00019534_092630 [Acytostelium subglobosum LB1]|uniref:hypothetical protein n=1 Tax=Acytostelium subglobosum LB1 TaxID=1410327 RepID=UPI0006449C89|nr:hypothetical protein SAMD00019534_092630 [Acytostelium subglobosum LB1]GAM26088.1 hypothetical protein SAMD00019534_092630 [Acytostelium subglobosum LB1]|eukprot:XP_012751131.1 hypothetical protein SAMD00019534_092630 [Acytostelium subglobosum LB1]